MMSVLEYTLFAFSSLFVIVDPIAIVPAFIAMTPHDTVESRLRTARLACTVAAGVLLGFALGGRWIFQFLGITLPAFQIAGSLLLLRIALDMLYARRSPAQETDEEVAAGAGKDDVAITPLAVPMLAGPGAISTSLILLNQADNLEQRLALLLCIVAICGVSYVILSVAVRSARRLSPLALKLATRLMGLLLAAVSVQFVLNALKDMGVPMRM